MGGLSCGGARAVKLILIGVVLASYGISLYINSVASQLLGPGVSPTLSTSLNACGRSAAAFLLLPILWVLGMRPPIEDGHYTVAFNRRTVVPVFTVFFGYLGFSGYYSLTFLSAGNTSLWAPAVGLYVCIPVCWGLLARGEKKTARKLGGIALSLVAIALLGLSSYVGSAAADGDEPASFGRFAMQALCFAVAYFSWGTADTLAVYIKTSPFESLAINLTAQLTVAAISGILGLVLASATIAGQQTVMNAAAAAGDAAALVVPADQVVTPFGWPHLLIMAGNGGALLGWLAYIALGRIAELSEYAAVCSLYSFVPVVLAVVFQGETIGVLKGAGLVAGIASFVLVAGGKQAAPPPPQPSSEVPAADSLTAVASLDLEQTSAKGKGLAFEDSIAEPSEVAVRGETGNSSARTAVDSPGIRFPGEPDGKVAAWP